MKLRIRDNSIRFRLTRDEVDKLRDEGIVASRTGFPGGRDFQYVLESSPASVNPGAFLSDFVMSVRLPETAVLAWATTDQVAIRGEQLLNDGESVSILVEKDFACLASREGEEESDMYPHPNAETADDSN